MFEWQPGTLNPGQQHGTLRTLEGYFSAKAHEMNCSLIHEQLNNITHCTEGLVSKNGWVLVNDSATPLLDGSDWDWVMPRGSIQTDWYFFGHGLNFKEALSEFTQIAGKIPLPPRYAFGIFWSRYWAFSDRGEKEIVREYVNHNTPLDILVVDMDWHQTFYKEAYKGQTDQAGQAMGWTGYTWDKHLFPDPSGFLNWVREQSLHITLNLHPASGIQPWEEKYNQMAIAMGINPQSGLYVPLNFTSKAYHTNLFDIVLDPLDIDFWWLDWQQYMNTSIPNLYPTFWLNYIFFTRFERTRSSRPLILHRWGGLGNHRYPLGFSGDVTPTWEALTFQTYFTPTAANVGFMWSHDIGGHTQPSPPELYTRWVQFGIWSPVFRTHCTKSPDNDRRIWAYPLQNFQIMRDAIELRSRMIPYIYTNARIAHDTGLALVYPLYYEWPELDSAYTEKNQYLFGSDIMVKPVTQPVDSTTQLYTQTVWIPPGQWIEWESLKTYTGPQYISKTYSLEEIPVFVKAGSVIPMLPVERPLLGSAKNQYTSLHLNVFCAGSGFNTSTTLYEDDGDDTYLNYQTQYAKTQIQYAETDTQISLLVFPPDGSYPGMPTTRSFKIQFNGILPPQSISVNGQPILYTNSSQELGWTYDSSYFSVLVNLPQQFLVANGLKVLVNKSNNPASALIGGIPRCLKRLKTVMNFLDNHFPVVFQEDYASVADANEIASLGVKVAPSVQNFGSLLQQGLSQISSLNLSINDQKQAMAFLSTC
eukprot:TRINITY_DN1970_c0_g1_i1.p1 TRINITY_DN1970_c0_g1~~TRINITY_DN1970_c0_g1_i1.p1  ORF type:complete len:875 (+),score=128.05 TRINITY_DN1970_c0_g1_i1:356-2626(+)